jgi:phosphoglycerate dehydrogenase-like enzyme
MNILFTTEKGPTRDIYFPARALQTLSTLGVVTFNEKETPLTPSELAEAIKDIDVCLTHWGCPPFTPEVLENANRLRLIAHAAGSVADLVTPEVYARGLQVCSANTVMAKYVAEGVLAYILAGLRLIPQQASAMKTGQLWEKKVVESQSLFGARVGLVGLGTIGRFLLDLLEPFDVQAKVFDPYLSKDALAAYPQAELCPTLEAVLSWGDVISLHASLTPATRGMIDSEKLSLIREGALFVNTARGAIVDEAALVKALQQRRFKAILDVYETEPLPLDSPLRSLDNAILLPHVAGIAGREQLTFAMLEEIAHFSRGEPLQHAIAYEKFALMTKEH